MGKKKIKQKENKKAKPENNKNTNRLIIDKIDKSRAQTQSSTNFQKNSWKSLVKLNKKVPFRKEKPVLNFYSLFSFKVSFKEKKAYIFNFFKSFWAKLFKIKNIKAFNGITRLFLIFILGLLSVMFLNNVFINLVRPFGVLDPIN